MCDTYKEELRSEYLGLDTYNQFVLLTTYRHPPFSVPFVDGFNQDKNQLFSMA